MVNQAVNRGVPVVIDSGRSKITKAFFNLADVLIAGKEMFVERRNIDQINMKEAVREMSGQLCAGQDLIGGF